MGTIKDKEGRIEYVCGGIYPKRLLMEVGGFNEWEENLVSYYNINVEIGNYPSLNKVPNFIFWEDGCIVRFFYGQLKQGGYKKFAVDIYQYVNLENMQNGFYGFEGLREYVKEIKSLGYIIPNTNNDWSYSSRDCPLDVYIITALECSVFLKLTLRFKVKRKDQTRFINDEQYFWYLSERFREFIYNGEKK